jgi:transposase-like protein
VIGEGRTVTDVAAAVGVSRQTLHAWLARYEAGGLEGLGDGSHRPRSCPHQMPAAVQALVLELRRRHPSWGAALEAACVALGRSYRPGRTLKAATSTVSITAAVQANPTA